MEAASLNEIKRALDELNAPQLKSLCLRLAKYKKENKELLSYLLFEEQDEAGYVESVKNEVSEEFANIPNLNTYYLKKSLRRILKLVNKQIRYSGINTTEVELRIHFCEQVLERNMPLSKSTVLMNLYQQQLKKIHQGLDKLDEDLRFDFEHRVKELNINSRHK
jgi:hypothetical protein